MSENTKARDEITRVGEILYNRQLAHGSAGNLSQRLDDGSFLITPTNSSLGHLDPARISHVAPDGATLLAGDKPSKEAFFHLAVYEERPTARAIVHLHSTHCVAISCMCHKNPDNILPTLTAYQQMKIGKLPLVPYYRPGDKALADAVRITSKHSHAMLLANHGPIVAGKSLNDATWAYEELEETAKIFLLLAQHKTSPLTPEQIAELNKAFPS
ncbi:MAG: aldolase [Alphaproteobacteria bacterium]|nr:aldolase [Alphaproteobacteria bacterium]